VLWMNFLHVPTYRQEIRGARVTGHEAGQLKFTDTTVSFQKWGKSIFSIIFVVILFVGMRGYKPVLPSSDEKAVTGH
jgi:hypothetical protein